MFVFILWQKAVGGDISCGSSCPMDPDYDLPIWPRVPRMKYLPHSARTDAGDDFVVREALIYHKSVFADAHAMIQHVHHHIDFERRSTRIRIDDREKPLPIWSHDPLFT